MIASGDSTPASLNARIELRTAAFISRLIRRASIGLTNSLTDGSSSVPQEWVQRINNAGGAMKNASGVDEKQYLPAAKLGVTKINIDTDGRLVWCAIHREFFRDHPEKFDLREPGKIFMPAYAEYIIHKNQMLGSAGHL